MRAAQEKKYRCLSFALTAGIGKKTDSTDGGNFSVRMERKRLGGSENPAFTGDDPDPSVPHMSAFKGHGQETEYLKP